MFLKRKKSCSDPGQVGAELVESLGAQISRLVGEANSAFDACDFKTAGDKMFEASLLSWQIAGIQISASILEALQGEVN